MSDFIQKANVKRSVRTLTTPIASVAALNPLVQNVIDTNPFNCVDQVSSGVTIPQDRDDGAGSFRCKVDVIRNALRTKP